jgi:hypothetical protein
LAVLCLASALTLVVLGTRLTFFNDEWYVLLLRPGVSAHSLLDPHNGHLSLIPIAVYKALVAMFGLDQQLPFRIVLAAVVTALGVLVFVFVRERCGDLLGLLAAALVLFLGAAWQDLLWSFQIGLVGSLVAGVGVLLCLERQTRRGDLAACLLLVASIALSNLGVSFILAAAVAIAVRTRRRPRDIWIPGVPSILFAAWWLAYGRDAETGFSLTNVGHTPAYVLDSIAAALSSLFGLSTQPNGGIDAYAWGRPLLLLAAVGIAFWLLRGGRPPRGVLPIAAAALSWWILLGFDFIPNWREPDTSRYQLISVTFLILLAAEAFRPVRLRPPALAAISAVTLACIGANIGALKDGYDFFHAESTIAKANLGALEIGRGQIEPKFRLLQPIARDIYLTGVFAGPYYRESEAHGSPAYSEAEIAAAPSSDRSAADVVLASGYSLRLQPLAAGSAPSAGCRRVDGAWQPAVAEVPRGGAVLINLSQVGAEVRLHRYADDFPADLGGLAPRGSARLAIPLDSASRSWELQISGTAVDVCPA